ncbi:MAG: deoxyribodipyrimidine photo-lyase [Candidatus Cloacimonetes bacterium]|nr:deoxyribodipyrimidine photo-lyase [Candidatus Cloacimonadota bacterium]
MIEKERIKKIGTTLNVSRDFVIYWMQSAQRIYYNHTLAYSIEESVKENIPLIVYFEIIDSFPEANYRHFQFMLQGLKDISDKLRKKNITFLISYTPDDLFLNLIYLSKRAEIIVTDRGYLSCQKVWREFVADNVKCPVFQIETDVIVPTETVSVKEEYSAATIRKKINSQIRNYLTSFPDDIFREYSLPLVDIKISGLISSERILSLANVLKIDHSVQPINMFPGGETTAQHKLKEFIVRKVSKYDQFKNEPGENVVSDLSPYLHFGQISPIQIYKEISELENSSESFLEELAIRRELSINFVENNPKYDTFECIPVWAKKTLFEHIYDEREYIYSLSELENAGTHDDYWNAAQKEMAISGKMHGYMRMYWCKKIIEWTSTPEIAFNNALYLNNKYSLDGRDPNSFTGVAWCFGKHDRAWNEREIFGKVRYMSSNGLKRKFDMDTYLRKIRDLEER